MCIRDRHKRALITGELKPGDKILSQRDFAQRYNVNPNTVQRAYREMEALDLVETLRGQGTFIAVTEEMLDTMKKDTARSILDSFVREMKTLGFSLQPVSYTHLDVYKRQGQGPSPTWEAGRRAVGTTLCGRPGLRVISRRRCQPYWGPVNYEFRKWKEPSPVRKWYSLRDGTEAVPYQ